MKKKANSRLEGVLTLAATVAALGTAVGVTPRDLLAADSMPAVQAEKANAAQGKIRPPANQHKMDAMQQKGYMGGVQPAGVQPPGVQPAAMQHKLNTGPGAGQYKATMAAPGANNIKGVTIKQSMNQAEGK
jgi:hypothetical protein